MEIDKKEYGEYVKKVTPVHSSARNILRAFVTGGAILSDRTGAHGAFFISWSGKRGGFGMDDSFPDRRKRFADGP